AGGEVVSVAGDVSRPSDVQEMVTRTLGTFGKLNVLYNNAAIFWPSRGDGPVTEIEEEIWDRVLATNLKGVYLCCKYGVPELIRAGGGSVINIASLAATRGAASAHAYSAAKGGVVSLTRSMAVTYGPHNIRVNAIAPGGIDTPMVRPGWDAEPARFQK